MPNTGGGQGTPVQAGSIGEMPYDQSVELDYIPNCAVSLSRYAKIVGYAEPSLWGVVYPGQGLLDCGPLWRESGRRMLETALAEAQQQIEQFIGYPLCRTWIAGSVDTELNHDSRWVDQQRFRKHMVTRYPRLISPGVRATQILSLGEELVHTEQVATATLTGQTLTDTSEVYVYYPDSGRRITPSKVTLSAGTLTIEIPRYRLVAQDLMNTPDGGIEYSELSAFLGSVDIVRVYNDPSIQAVLVRPNCSNGNCGGCGECTRDGCIYIRDAEIGYIDVRPAAWDANTLTWNSKQACWSNYSIVRLNYMAGLRYINLQTERAIIRLAHTKMQVPPCACDTLEALWKQDSTLPDVLTRERINCPFGRTNGAWDAYILARSIASIRADIL